MTHCSFKGGTLLLPSLVLVDRQAGGHLIVNPVCDVWERSELSPDELTQWSILVAAVGRSMLEVLPQLQGGCINYWEAGNWSLHHDAEPVGPKDVQKHRRVHMHLLGRSVQSKDPDWTWGEAPKFPAFQDRLPWASRHQQLTHDEFQSVVAHTTQLLIGQYAVAVPLR